MIGVMDVIFVMVMEVFEDGIMFVYNVVSDMVIYGCGLVVVVCL